MCYALIQSMLCLVFSWMWRRRARNGYCPTFVCWPWWTPQDGRTPLYKSAYNGHKEVVEILLQNGAEVNAANKVICDGWTDVIQWNACQGGKNEGQSVGNGIGNGRLHWVNCPWISLMRFHGISLDIHAWDRLLLMMHIVWNAFSCGHVSVWTPLRSDLSLNPFLMEMACARDGALVCMFFDKFSGLNRKLDCWVWIWTAFEFPLKAKNVIQSTTFSKHSMRLASFGTFVHQCVVMIERACFLEQAGRCVYTLIQSMLCLHFLEFEIKGQ